MPQIKQTPQKAGFVFNVCKMLLRYKNSECCRSELEVN